MKQISSTGLHNVALCLDWPPMFLLHNACCSLNYVLNMSWSGCLHLQPAKKVANSKITTLVSTVEFSSLKSRDAVNFMLNMFNSQTYCIQLWWSHASLSLGRLASVPNKFLISSFVFPPKTAHTKTHLFMMHVVLYWHCLNNWMLSGEAAQQRWGIVCVKSQLYCKVLL